VPGIFKLVGSIGIACALRRWSLVAALQKIIMMQNRMVGFS